MRVCAQVCMPVGARVHDVRVKNICVKDLHIYVYIKFQIMIQDLIQYTFVNRGKS